MKDRPVEVRIFARIVRLAQLINRQAEDELADREVTPAQFFILATIARKGPLKQNELSRRLAVTASNISQLLVKLEASSLIERSAEGAAKVVSLTDSGRELLDTLKPEHDSFIVDRFRALTRDERRTMLAWLERVIESLTAGSDAGP